MRLRLVVFCVACGLAMTSWSDATLFAAGQPGGSSNRRATPETAAQELVVESARKEAAARKLRIAQRRATGTVPYPAAYPARSLVTEPGWLRIDYGIAPGTVRAPFPMRTPVPNRN
ncbi:hypothetical protein GC163_22125 [bacterium]|nr:hypothetical protein [bacterium]